MIGVRKFIIVSKLKEKDNRKEREFASIKITLKHVQVDTFTTLKWLFSML